MIDIATPQSLVAEGLEAIRSEVVEAEIFAAGNEPLAPRLNYTSDMPCHGVQEPKSSAAYGVGVPATVRENGFRFGGEGTGLYIGRIWYTYPINGLGPGD